jgi:uncharacterized protein YjbI with pentapeptide repeats
LGGGGFTGAALVATALAGAVLTGVALTGVVLTAAAFAAGCLAGAAFAAPFDTARGFAFAPELVLTAAIRLSPRDIAA